MNHLGLWNLGHPCHQESRFAWQTVAIHWPHMSAATVLSLPQCLRKCSFDKSSNIQVVHQITTSASNHFRNHIQNQTLSALGCHGGHDDCICSSVDPTRSTGCQEPCGGAGQRRKTSRSASDGIGFQARPCQIWVCLKMWYIPNYSHLIGIMIINHWV